MTVRNAHRHLLSLLLATLLPTSALATDLVVKVVGVIDINFLGEPREPWGVSNNARPTLRPPRWSEAVFQVVDGEPLAIEVRVSR